MITTIIILSYDSASSIYSGLSFLYYVLYVKGGFYRGLLRVLKNLDSGGGQGGGSIPGSRPIGTPAQHHPPSLDDISSHNAVIAMRTPGAWSSSDARSARPKNAPK